MGYIKYATHILWGQKLRKPVVFTFGGPSGMLLMEVYGHPAWDGKKTRPHAGPKE